MLRKCEGHSKTLMVVQATTGEVFGCYATEVWENRVGEPKFYGNGESFLYKVRGGGGGRRREGGGGEEVTVHRWTGDNTLFQLLDHSLSRIALGGGGEEGNFGLCIDDDFARGTTGPCETYGNREGLCEGGVFEIIGVEVYGFVT
ncbi:hypothetical protein TrCOL_g9441 [Triparma columacea]|uniref:Oxidation resistance protein 1 n=1 Tax=Triparma columacea TaxID=722753 RepID=A0A9W7L3V4_9STRA|nr:hypothetical protein TrCOL_g9441 [Triparma columacea]